MNRISKDDPRVTAYALGELDGDELALVAAAVQADAELQAVVAEIRATAGALEQALAGEPAPELPAKAHQEAREETGPVAGFPAALLRDRRRGGGVFHVSRGAPGAVGQAGGARADGVARAGQAVRGDVVERAEGGGGGGRGERGCD